MSEEHNFSLSQNAACFHNALWKGNISSYLLIGTNIAKNVSMYAAMEQ